jgi:hypothetical protein
MCKFGYYNLYSSKQGYLKKEMSSIVSLPQQQLHAAHLPRSLALRLRGSIGLGAARLAVLSLSP